MFSLLLLLYSLVKSLGAILWPRLYILLSQDRDEIRRTLCLKFWAAVPRMSHTEGVGA